MKDTIVESLLEKYKARSIKGITKYGISMDRDDLNLIDWLTHAQEEAMDLAIYLEKIIKQLKWESSDHVKDSAWKNHQ